MSVLVDDVLSSQLTELAYCGKSDFSSLDSGERRSLASRIFKAYDSSRQWEIFESDAYNFDKLIKVVIDAMASGESGSEKRKRVVDFIFRAVEEAVCEDADELLGDYSAELDRDMQCHMNSTGFAGFLNY